MKRGFRLVVLALAVFLSAGLFAAGSGSASIITLDIQAFTDGRDRLVIRGDTLQWYHYDYELPGMWDGNNFPTIINTSLNGVPVLTNVDWYPTWSGTISDVFTGVSPAVPPTQDVTLTVVQARYLLWMVQAPNAGNGYTTIIEFNDDPLPGPAWYEARLDYTTVPLPAAVWFFGPGLAGLAAMRRRFRK